MLRGLTLIQPMGWAIVYRHKPFENRSRDIRPLELRGVRTRIAIHNGQKWDDGYGQMVHHLTGVVPQNQPMHIIGLATLTGRLFTLGNPPPSDAQGIEWFTGPFAFEIDTSESVVLERPISCRGMLGFWPVPRDAELAIAAQGAF